MIIRFLLFIIIVFISCAPSGPISPYDSFEQLKSALMQKDVAAIKNLLSANSIKKIKKTGEVFALMDKGQLVSVAASYKLSSNKLARLSVDDFLKIYIVKGRDSIFEKIIEAYPLRIKKNANVAELFLNNGISVFFVKEGPYWKFNIDSI